MARFWRSIQPRETDPRSKTPRGRMLRPRQMRAGLLVLASTLVFATTAAADEPQPPENPVASETAKPVDDQILEEQLFEEQILRGEGCAGDCCVNTGQKVIMGAGSGAAFFILFFLLVRLVERAFIRRESSPLLGRHLGISMAMFLGGLGMLAIFYLVGGCWHASYLLWGLFIGAAWALHGLYTLFAVRGR